MTGDKKKEQQNLLRKYLNRSKVKNEHTIAFFIDLKKTFDTVDHSILLEMLKNYGTGGTPINWMHSYLNSRFQYMSKLTPLNSHCFLLNVVFPRVLYLDYYYFF